MYFQQILFGWIREQIYMSNFDGRLCYNVIKGGVQMFADALIERPEQLSLFEELYNTYSQGMFYDARNFTHDIHKAEDMVSEAFLRVAKNIDTISKVPSENMRKYLHILIRNICIDERRKSNHSEEMYEKFSDVAGTHSTENMAIGTVAIREIADIILRMPEKYKDMLLLVYYYDHTVEEASIAMGISANAAYQRLSRAKKLLKDILTKEGQL
ncbi:sigma-70 family RNA polymerase sigma factor [Butyricicoccus sp. AF22-28AC]|nr:sigma-70 family RNA polymerase sigma factor [Butyricicoccus sp. AF22-28AC]